MRGKHCEIVTDVEHLTVDIQQVCKSYSTIKEWAYILHDKDDTKPHYHIYLHFGQGSQEFDKVAKWFNLEPSFVSKIKGRKADALKYLTHSNDSQKNKHQYDKSEIIANFDVQQDIVSDSILGDFDKYSFKEQLKYCDSLPVSEKIKAHNKLKGLWEIRCKLLAGDSNRNIKVIFMSGHSGTGKTYCAKQLLERMNMDYCVSSSSNDPFQDYMGEKAFIFDELRDDSIKDFQGKPNLAELLKILDNNTASSIKSRFQNKVFNGDLIIITSSVDINQWFKSLNTSESLVQLYRRITCYIKVTKDELRIYDDGLTDKGYPKGTYVSIENEAKRFELENNQKRFKCSEMFLNPKDKDKAWTVIEQPKKTEQTTINLENPFIEEEYTNEQQ